MLGFLEAKLEANNYTSLKAPFMSGSGFSDRGYNYPRRFHRIILVEADWRVISYFLAKVCIFVLGWMLLYKLPRRFHRRLLFDEVFSRD